MLTIFWPVKLAVWLLKGLLNLLVFAACALTLFAMMGGQGWLWSLSTHFHVQYLFIQLLALLIVGITYWKKSKQGESALSRFETWISLVSLLFFAGLNLSRLAPYYWPAYAPKDVNAPAEARLKVMHVNLFGYLNRDRELVKEVIRAQDPDIIGFVEYTTPWQRDLENSSLLRRYPYRVAGRSHIGLYSKRPIQNARLVYTDQSQSIHQANIIAQFNLNRQRVTLLLAHPASPIWPERLTWQQASFQRWIQDRPRLGKNLLIMGDLNTTPWSREFTELLQKTGLRDSQLGFGLQPSWPTFLPFVQRQDLKSLLALPFGIPIDHILVSPGIKVLSRHTGPYIGSDHLPVIAELTVSNQG